MKILTGYSKHTIFTFIKCKWPRRNNRTERKMAQSSTPRKTCLLGDICILCGFSFVSIETIDRKENIHKFYDVNIKINKERKECVRKVSETQFNLESCITCNSGVCRKCFRSVKSILKTWGEKQCHEGENQTKLTSGIQKSNIVTALFQTEIYHHNWQTNASQPWSTWTRQSSGKSLLLTATKQNKRA